MAGFSFLEKKMAIILEEEVFHHLDEILKKYNEMGHLLGDPKVISNRGEFQRVAKEQAELVPIVEKYDYYKKILKRINEAEEIISDSSSDSDIRELAEEEKNSLEKELEDLEKEIKLLLLPKDPRDKKNIIMEIRAGAGGDLACLFAAELFRMYARYAEKNRWKVDILNSNFTGLGGLKEIIFSLEGKGIYSKLKFESGVHRVQRVPATEASGRIHTSTVTVAVLPEAEDVDVKIDERDLKVDVYRSSGPGGQGVNTTDSAVRITHLPTGLVVTCQDERSQIKNRAKAMRVLKARLLERAQEEQQAAIAADRRSQVGTGERSERIRTYNFPQARVTDHRIGLTLHRLHAVLEGDLDELIETLAAAEQAERLQRGAGWWGRSAAGPPRGRRG